MTFAHQHILDINSLSQDDINSILDLAKHYAQTNRSPNKKTDKLYGKTIANMFFENSTRTRTSFEIAAKRLGADVINFSSQTSSLTKGETMADTMRVVDSMNVDCFVIRHKEDGFHKQASGIVNGSIINAGEGISAHPTQALLDARTMLNHKPALESLRVAICGDVEHSRVARSNARLLQKFGAEVRFFAPPMFVPKDRDELGVTLFDSLEEAIENADVVMMLRIQNERLEEGETPLASNIYHEKYGLNHERLRHAKEDVIVMHPAPLNRGIEITSELADDEAYSVIFEQMEMGVAVRMACLDLVLSQ
ncbi:MAG: aspartate carbamoyltransferase catalytic subunit [Bdellovibrionales bacterium]